MERIYEQGDMINSSLPVSFKVNVCFPVLAYGSETWRVTRKQERKLRGARRGMEKKMLGVM